MRAIILAAGLGSRLLPLSEKVPKCLLDLQGKTVLERQLDLLDWCGVDDIKIVVGHCGDAVREAIGGRAGYIEYPNFSRTNNLHTLQYCGDLLTTDVVVLFADVLVDCEAFVRCLRSPFDFALLVDSLGRRKDTMRIRMNNHLITDLGGHVKVEECDGNFTGIAKFSTEGARELRSELDRTVQETGFEGSYYTQAIARLASAGKRINPVDVGDAEWFEIDSLKDYQQALKKDFYLRSLAKICC
jgi:L-glutamine-phosphate cytidylyltransferase